MVIPGVGPVDGLDGCGRTWVGGLCDENGILGHFGAIVSIFETAEEWHRLHSSVYCFGVCTHLHGTKSAVHHPNQTSFFFSFFGWGERGCVGGWVWGWIPRGWDLGLAARV